MAILNFPPTTGEPDDGSFTYTLNGVLYAWDGQKWTANTESELDSRYVERTGDNMTGDLTLGGDKITLAADGSAEFAAGTSAQPGVFIGKNNSNGAYPTLYLQQDNPNGNFLTCKNGFTGAITSTIAAGGSATFGALGGVNSDKGSVQIYNGGKVRIDSNVRTDQESTAEFIQCTNNGSNRVNIKRDGSATFAGSLVQFGDYDFTSTTTSGATIDDGALTVQRTASTGGSSRSIAGRKGPNITWEINVDGVGDFSNTTFRLEADDDTKYTTTADADGNETRVYNGAVLDVKDRLTKLDTALSGLKSALVSTTDHASLKAALITALADI